MTNVKERIKPVLSAILKTIYAEKADNHRLELTRLPEPYKGWIDGFERVELPQSYTDYEAQLKNDGGIESSFLGNFYYTIFDLENTDGEQLRKKFWESTTNGVVYDFNPIPSFRVKGTLQKHGVINNLEWVVLATME